MADRPIIFSAPMVRALLDGRKTQTRRIIKGVRQDNCMVLRKSTPKKMGLVTHVMDAPGTKVLPYAPGNRLWVRETWSAIMNGGWTIADARRRMFNEKIVYRADGHGYEDGDGWWASIHMPREFSRLTLTVTDVRVQRLQEISEADAIAEGVTRCGWAEDMAGDGRHVWHVPEHEPGEYTGLTNAYPSPVAAFWELWDHIHGPFAWDRNEWVCALTFTVQRGNIDQLGATA